MAFRVVESWLAGKLLGDPMQKWSVLLRNWRIFTAMIGTCEEEGSEETE